MRALFNLTSTKVFTKSLLKSDYQDDDDGHSNQRRKNFCLKHTAKAINHTSKTRIIFVKTLGCLTNLGHVIPFWLDPLIGCVLLLPRTAPERSRLVSSRSFFYVWAIRFAFYNSGRDQSERSDFAPTKTCNETNCHAHLFTVLRGNGEF